MSKGPPGSHAISGSWRITKVKSASDNGLTVTYQGTADGLKMSDPNGENYDAKFDGKDYPVQGDPGHTFVSLKRLGNDTIEETDKRNGKLVGIAKMTVSSDGKWITVVFTDRQRRTTTTYKMEKQSRKPRKGCGLPFPEVVIRPRPKDGPRAKLESVPPVTGMGKGLQNSVSAAVLNDSMAAYEDWPRFTANVTIAFETSFSSKFFSANTSASHTTSMLPARSTRPRQRSRSAMAGRRKLILNSTLTTSWSKLTAPRAAQPEVWSAMVAITPA